MLVIRGANIRGGGLYSGGLYSGFYGICMVRKITSKALRATKINIFVFQCFPEKYFCHPIRMMEIIEIVFRDALKEITYCIIQ